MDAIKAVEETESAKTEFKELEPQISEYELAKTADDLLPPLEDLNRRAFNLRDELKRTTKLKEEAASRLAASKGSKMKLKDLEAKISSLNHNKSNEVQFKTYGLVGIISGLILAAVSIIQPLFAILGIINIIAGVLLYRISNTAQFDPEITILKGKNVDLLRDQQRIREHAYSLERAQQVEKALLDELARVEVDVHEITCLLPTKPSDYAAVFERGGLLSLRQKITDDLQTLARLNTERKGAQKIFNELDQCLYVLRIFEEAFRGCSEGLQSIQNKIHEPNEAGLFSRDEEAIRDEIDEASIPATVSYPA
ncbi:MAG: hypothetical protein NTY03_15485 [Candidatus Bathyarchaeota archaeon]|nr:hypothetical protein [Candidatus Bathyarchaeota archaeon]